MPHSAAKFQSAAAKRGTRRLSKKRASKDVGRDFDDYEVSKTTKRKRRPKNSFRLALENIYTRFYIILYTYMMGGTCSKTEGYRNLTHEAMLFSF